jgi:hypothetical protein
LLLFTSAHIEWNQQWANKMNRIKRKVLHLPKAEGCFNLPDLELYQLATQGIYFGHMVKCTKEEQWVYIEDAHAHPQNICMCLFLKE